MAIQNRSFIGDIGTIITVNTKEDLNSSTVTELHVQKPDGTEVVWTAAVHNTYYLRYIVKEGDFDQAGVYRIQAYVELPLWSGKGDVANFRIFDKFEE